MARKKQSSLFKLSDFKEELCPLCLGHETSLFSQDRRRAYLQCSECALVFVPKCFHLTSEQEKAEYDLHENNPEDEGYHQFLSRCFDPVVDRLPDSSEGLDFGCGPGPLLAEMFERAGYSMSVYDPYFAPSKEVLSKPYNFVTCTEVIEHVSRPNEVWSLLSDLLLPGGLLAVMTKRVATSERFKNWHYKNDRTHICFYSEATFEWLSSQLELEYEVVGDDVVLFSKPNK